MKKSLLFSLATSSLLSSIKATRLSSGSEHQQNCASLAEVTAECCPYQFDLQAYICATYDFCKQLAIDIALGETEAAQAVLDALATLNVATASLNDALTALNGVTIALADAEDAYATAETAYNNAVLAY